MGDIYDRDGNYAGRVTNDGDKYDQNGNYAGRVTSDGDHYDRDGNYAGRTNSNGDHYDRNGNYAGRTNSSGDSYDRNGNYSGNQKKDSGGCFISTACVQAENLPDSCRELVTLRSFRDNHLMKSIDGKQAVKRYYTIAPNVVKLIDEDPNSKQIYADLYNRLVRRSVRLIELGERTAAYRNYEGIVNELEKKYPEASKGLIGGISKEAPIFRKSNKNKVVPINKISHMTFEL